MMCELVKVVPSFFVEIIRRGRSIVQPSWVAGRPTLVNSRFSEVKLGLLVPAALESEEQP